MDSLGHPAEEGLAALACTGFLGMFLCAITGFGENITFQLGWYWMSLAGLSSGSLADSVSILTVVQLPLLAVQAAALRRHVNVGMGLLMGAAQCAAGVAGVSLLVRYDGDCLKRVLGLVLVAVFLWRVLLEAPGRERLASGAAPPPGTYRIDSLRRAALVSAVGLASGLLGGLFSTPGPPNMVFVLVAGVGKDEWRSTQAVCGLVQLPTRLAALALQPGAPGLGRLWPQCAVTCAAGLVGLAAGNALAPRVSEGQFRGAILALLLFGGLSLLAPGRPGAAGALAAAAAAGLALPLRAGCRPAAARAGGGSEGLLAPAS